MEQTDSWKSLAATAWNEKAEGWNENSKAMWDHGSRKDILPFFTKHIPTEGDMLDIGCGSGYSTQRLDGKGYKVTGMDLSDKMISFAKQQYPNVPFQQGDVTAMPFTEATFAGVLAINVLEWAEVPYDALLEVKRVLQEDGLLCIGILGPTAGPRQHSYDRLYGEQVMMNTMQPWEFLQLAKAAGFALVDQLYVPRKWGINVEEQLPGQAKQALSFMTVFMLRKSNKAVSS